MIPDNKTKLVGVIGHPIIQSFSPLIQNLAFQIRGLNYLYLPFDVPATNLKEALTGITALGIAGLNVTIPHKVKILDYLSDISEEASIIGSVNTIVNDNGELRGYNTDVIGVNETLIPFAESIRNSEVTVIGAGGAARTAVYCLLRNFKPSRVNVVNRTLQKADSIKDYFTAKMIFRGIKTFELLPPDLTGLFANSSLIINTTSVGMYPDNDDAVTTIAESFSSGQIIFDMVYNPMQTKLLAIASERGAHTVGGLKMFVEQGAASFELWTGAKMPKEAINEALGNALAELNIQ